MTGQGERIAAKAPRPSRSDTGTGPGSVGALLLGCLFLLSVVAATGAAQTCRTPDGTSVYILEPAAEDIGNHSEPCRDATDDQGYGVIYEYVDDVFDLTPQATFERLVQAIEDPAIGVLFVHCHSNASVITIEYYDDTPDGLAARDASLQEYRDAGYTDLTAGADHGAYYIRISDTQLAQLTSSEDSHTDGAIVYAKGCNTAGLNDDWNALAAIGYNETISGLAGTDVFWERMDGARDRGPGNLRRSVDNAGDGIAHLVGYIGEYVVLAPVIVDHFPQAAGLAENGDVGYVEFDCEMDTSTPANEVVQVSGSMGTLSNVHWSNNHRIEFTVTGLDPLGNISFRVSADRAVSAHNEAHLDGNTNPPGKNGVGPNNDFYTWTSLTSHYALMDLEDGTDGETIRSTIPGMEFTTTAGFDWIYGDKTTEQYNIYPYNDSQYWCDGNFFAWLGPNQGNGRIDFTGSTATSVSAGVSSYAGLHIEAYDANGQLIDADFVAGNLETNMLSQLKVSGSSIHHVIFHDSGNYWLIDNLMVVDLLQESLILLPEDLAIVLEALHTISPGVVENFLVIVNDISDNLEMILNWLGSEMQLCVFQPDGQLYGVYQTTTPPIAVSIPNPLAGEWRVEVRAIDIPYDDYPFAVAAAVAESPTADILVTASDIHFSPEHPGEGDIVNILVDVTCPVGSAPISQVLVRCFLGDPTAGGTLIDEGEYALDLVPGGKRSVYFHWDTSGAVGTAEVHVVVDPDNTLPETDEENNHAWTTLMVAVRATAAVFRVDAAGNVLADQMVYATAFETGAADIAEWVWVSEPVERGDVLEFDPVNPQCYRRSTEACSVLLAGVVSSIPGVVLGVSEPDQPKALLALTGIVPVKVTNEGGPIQPGDLLVTSSTPGYAMRCTASDACPCTLVGKALESLDEAQGVILVLLTAH